MNIIIVCGDSGAIGKTTIAGALQKQMPFPVVVNTENGWIIDEQRYGDLVGDCRELGPLARFCVVCVRRPVAFALEIDPAIPFFVVYRENPFPYTALTTHEFCVPRVDDLEKEQLNVAALIDAMMPFFEK